MFYVSEQPLLPNLLEELGNDNVADARQSAGLDEKAAAANGSSHAVNGREGLPSERPVIEHLRD